MVGRAFAGGLPGGGGGVSGMVGWWLSHLAVVLVLEPLEDDGGVEAARVGEDDLHSWMVPPPSLSTVGQLKCAMAELHCVKPIAMQRRRPHAASRTWGSWHSHSARATLIPRRNASGFIAQSSQVVCCRSPAVYSWRSVAPNCPIFPTTNKFENA